MAYFSNGSESRNYQCTHCNHCAHDVKHDCPVWMAHIMHNGADALNVIIPRTPDKLSNDKCRMFVEVQNEDSIY